jgi:hypothetical protein
MIDVHPAPHAAHSWRDFLIHIATITIGLLLALALEQSVEAVHRNHQRHRLEENLHDESLLNRRIVAYDFDSVNQVRRNIRSNMTNLDRHGGAFVPAPPTHDTFLPLINTAWIAGRTNGLVTLLPSQLGESYWKVNFLIDATAASIQSLADARKKVNSLLYLHDSASQLTPEERAALLRAYSEEDQELGNLNYILHGYHYMNEAVLAGRVPTIDDLTTESRQAQQTEAQPAPVNAQ